MAPHPDACARPGGAAVAGGHRGHAVAAQCRWEANATMPASTLLDVTGWCPERPRTRRATRLRLVSVFRHGWVRRLVALLRQEPLPEGRLVPEPWPALPPLAGDPYGPDVVLPEAA